MKKQAYIIIFLTALIAGGVWPKLAVAESVYDGTPLLDERDAYPAYAWDRYISYNAMVPSRGAVYDRMGQFVSYGQYG